jgi:hypothetical protein
MLFRTLVLAGAAALVIAVPVPTQVSAQPAVEVGPGGVRVGHERWESRRREERRGCRTVTVREHLPGGGEKVIKRRECRD